MYGRINLAQRGEMMVTAAKTMSQVATHMGIAFAIMYAMTGSVAFGGLAALIEPVINVLLLPLHHQAWNVLRRSLASHKTAIVTAAQKLSQVGLHMGVAFVVVYWATGSAAFGGLAVIIEPICNVILLPFHDQAWEKFRQRLMTEKSAINGEVPCVGLAI